MDALSTVINLIRPGVYMAPLDLKHAYYTIPIAAEHRKYLKFVWGGQLYEFQSLPMGLTSSPRIFTKIMKPVLASLRQKRYTNSGYIDDFYLQEADLVDCCNNVKDTVDLFSAIRVFHSPRKMYLDTHSGYHISGLYIKFNSHDGLFV